MNKSRTSCSQKRHSDEVDNQDRGSSNVNGTEAHSDLHARNPKSTFSVKGFGVKFVFKKTLEGLDLSLDALGLKVLYKRIFGSSPPKAAAEDK